LRLSQFSKKRHDSQIFSLDSPTLFPEENTKKIFPFSGFFPENARANIFFPTLPEREKMGKEVFPIRPEAEKSKIAPKKSSNKATVCEKANFFQPDKTTH